MAEIAANTEHPIELRARMYSELAHYVYPKRKAIDPFHDGVDQPIEFTLKLGEKVINEEYVDSRSGGVARCPT